MEIGSHNPFHLTHSFSPNTVKTNQLGALSDSKDNPQNTLNESNQALKPGSETEAKTKHEEGNDKQKTGEQQLTPEEKKQVEELKARDREVRAHEAAHKAAAGQHATSGASFTYQRGPDGQRYAVGGEVGISTSPVPNNPEATLQKANIIRAAALAPAQPSGQDMAVAAKASMMAADARAEIAKQNREEIKTTTENNKDESEATEQYKQVAQSEDKSLPLFDQLA